MISIPAGVGKMPLAPFLVATLIGATLWNAFLLQCGMTLREHWHLVQRAILGVETKYGRHTGSYRVIDALSTLAFAYPPRSRFFSEELEQFLLLCRDENVNPLQPLGSYAGAMGMPQFMPSSFRSFAIDFNKDGSRDLWHDKTDVIASIANYFTAHGWVKNKPIAVPVFAKNENYKSLLNESLKPNLRIDELESARVEFSRPLPLDSKVKLLALEQELVKNYGLF